MKNIGIRELHAYWNALRGRRSAPERADIDPSSIRQWLGDVFILDLDDSAGAVFRLAGTRICSLFNHEIRNWQFCDLFEAREKTEISNLLRGVSTEEKPLVAGIVAHTEGGGALVYELLLLPLRHRGFRGKRMLGMLAAAEELPLFMKKATYLNMLTLKMLDEELSPRINRTPTFVTGLTGDQIASRHGHLVLINGTRENH